MVNLVHAVLCETRIQWQGRPGNECANGEGARLKATKGTKDQSKELQTNETGADKEMHACLLVHHGLQIFCFAPVTKNKSGNDQHCKVLTCSRIVVPMESANPIGAQSMTIVW